MNPDTGQMYFTEEDVKAARLRGEPLVELTHENIERSVEEARQTHGDARPKVVPLSRGQLRRRMREGGK